MIIKIFFIVKIYYKTIFKNNYHTINLYTKVLTFCNNQNLKNLNHCNYFISTLII